MISPGTAIEGIIAALPHMGLEALREQWRELYGNPPALRSADLLRRNIAWRLQADRLGGLDAETRRALASKRGTLTPELPVGTRLAREWQGRRYEVTIVESGVQYGEQVFASLSQVARTITGVRWNGPRFFGLRVTESEAVG